MRMVRAGTVVAAAGHKNSRSAAEEMGFGANPVPVVDCGWWSCEQSAARANCAADSHGAE